LPEVVAGVSIHPSHSVMIPQLGEDEADILGQVEAPQLFLPTMTDSDNVKPGGLSETVLAEKVVISFHHITDHIIQGLGGIRGALPDHETWLPHPRRHIGSRSCS